MPRAVVDHSAQAGSGNYPFRQIAFNEAIVEGSDVEFSGGDLAAHVAALGSTVASLRIRTGTTCTLTASLVIPATITLICERGSLIVVPTGLTLTINGALVAGRWQIISLQGTAVIAGSAKINEAFPEWFGAAADNATDSRAAIQHCLDWTAAPTTLAAGHYLVSGPLTHWQEGFTFRGAGTWKTEISPYTATWTNSNPGYLVRVGPDTGSSTSTNHIGVADMHLHDDGANPPRVLAGICIGPSKIGVVLAYLENLLVSLCYRGIEITNAVNLQASNVRCSANVLQGLYCPDTLVGGSSTIFTLSSFRNCLFMYNGTDGVYLENGSGLSFINCDFERNNQNGCKLKRLNTTNANVWLQNIVFYGCWFESNAQGQNADLIAYGATRYADLWIDGYSVPAWDYSGSAGVNTHIRGVILDGTVIASNPSVRQGTAADATGGATITNDAGTTTFATTAAIWSAGDVGKPIEIWSAANAGNNNSGRNALTGESPGHIITEYVDPNTVKFVNANGVTEGAGFGWKVMVTQHHHLILNNVLDFEWRRCTAAPTVNSLYQRVRVTGVVDGTIEGGKREWFNTLYSSLGYGGLRVLIGGAQDTSQYTPFRGNVHSLQNGSSFRRWFSAVPVTAWTKVARLTKSAATDIIGCLLDILLVATNSATGDTVSHIRYVLACTAAHTTVTLVAVAASTSAASGGAGSDVRAVASPNNDGVDIEVQAIGGASTITGQVWVNVIGGGRSGTEGLFTP